MAVAKSTRITGWIASVKRLLPTASLDNLSLAPQIAIELPLLTTIHPTLHPRWNFQEGPIEPFRRLPPKGV